MSIAEIAASLGFEDNSYFTKFFKKQTALTPEDFRKRTLKIKEYENDKLR